MANKKKVSEEVEVVSLKEDTTEKEKTSKTKVSNKEKKSEVTTTEETKVEVLDKVIEKTRKDKKDDAYVRIKMRADHRCTIGGTFYDFKKDSCYNVPKNVKMILSRADLLLPL